MAYGQEGQELYYILYKCKNFFLCLQQALAIWDWTVEGEIPLCTAELSPSYGLQTYIYFNPDDQSQLVTNSDTQVIFYSWVS